jgi:hypothetical protein
VRLPKAWLTLHVENPFVLLMVQNSFVLSMWVHSTFFVNFRKVCCHTKQLAQWPNLMLKGLAK